MSSPLKLGIAGLGTVGAGVVALLEQNGQLLGERAGREIAVKAWEDYGAQSELAQEALDAHIRDHAESAYHPCGTCRMGRADDPGAVVDPQCRVIGVEGLRVVDSPVIPRRLASTAVAMPTDEVPPRIRIDWPGWASRPTVSEPYEVCSISGTAPSVAQSRSLSNGTV